MPTKQGYSHILYNNLLTQIETIGVYMEAITDPIPYPGIRLKDGDLNVSTIIEVSTLKLARELKRVSREQFKQYLADYLVARKVERTSGKRHEGERLVVVSEATLDSIQAIGEHLKEFIPDQYLFPTPKRLLNNKLVIAFAILHTAAFIEQQK